jgi:hypothetical protein
MQVGFGHCHSKTTLNFTIRGTLLVFADHVTEVFKFVASEEMITRAANGSCSNRYACGRSSYLALRSAGMGGVNHFQLHTGMGGVNHFHLHAGMGGGLRSEHIFEVSNRCIVLKSMQRV